MKLKQLIYTSLAVLGILTSCSDDISSPTLPVGEADNAIVLRARVSESGNSLQTRSVDDNHAKHTPFDAGNKMKLQINGTWTGKGTITQETTGTTKAEEESSKHNEVETAPLRFWNDYGVADPNNTEGRAYGLTIYGAAVNDKTQNAPTVSNWETLSWDLPANQTAGWTKYDLLTSNNIRPISDGGDGTFKFEDFLNKATGTSNILEFTHAMSKITVVLTASDGFPEYKFENNPTVTLKQFKNTGHVNIKAKTSTANDTKKDINMHLDEGGSENSTATFNAIVYPGNKFDKVDDKDVDILELTADGNTFVVTAEKLNAAIQAAITNKATTGYSGTDNSLQQGWNYQLLITVKKTGISVVATIVDWRTVEADEVTPKINISTAYGLTVTGDEKAFTNKFDFFRSTTIGSGYSNDATVTYNEEESKYKFSTPLYWPNHSTHYFFRGVYPIVGEVPLTPSDNFTTTATNASTISVKNVSYEAGKYPSDLAIGYPRTTTETCRHSKTVATQGICATEGEIRMNFRYTMSQVEVKLTSAEVNGQVNLDENTIIKIVDGYTAGNIKLEDGSAVCTGEKQDYIMQGGTAVDRLDAIVPQTLGDMKFVIIVKNGEGNFDNYECRIADIKVGGIDITAWEAGKKYVYTLEIQKTAIKTTATLKDWVTVNATENVWF